MRIIAGVASLLFSLMMFAVALMVPADQMGTSPYTAPAIGLAALAFGIFQFWFRFKK